MIVSLLFYSCLNFSIYEVAVNVTILRESVGADAVLGVAVLFVLVVQQSKLSFCCLASGLVSNLWFMSITIWDF